MTKSPAAPGARRLCPAAQDTAGDAHWLLAMTTAGAVCINWELPALNFGDLPNGPFLRWGVFQNHGFQSQKDLFLDDLGDLHSRKPPKCYRDFIHDYRFGGILVIY